MILQADPSLAGRSRTALLELSEAMAAEGEMLIQRVIPSEPDKFRQWDHYPSGDAIDPDSRARWFYHAHPPEQRAPGEHGHFHIFLPLSIFEGVQPISEPQKDDAVRVVHVAALSFDLNGLPTDWMTVNQWVTNEYMMPAEAIIARLGQLTLSRAGEKQGLEKIGRWLGLALHSCWHDIAAMLRERDNQLALINPRDRGHEILSTRSFALC